MSQKKGWGRFWSFICLLSPNTENRLDVSVRMRSLSRDDRERGNNLHLQYTFSHFFIISVSLLSAATLLSLAPDDVIWAPFFFNLFWLLQIHQSDSPCLWYSFIYYFIKFLGSEISLRVLAIVQKPTSKKPQTKQTKKSHHIMEKPNV